MSNPFENTGATAPTKSKKAASFDVTAHNSAHKPPADPMLAASGGTQSVIPIRKPGKKFFRVHPDPAYHAYGVLALVDKDDKSPVHFLSSDLALPDDVAVFASYVHLFVCVTQFKKLFIWNVSATDGSWLTSSLECAKLAQDKWIRIQADTSTGGYDTWPAPPVLQAVKPDFGNLSAQEVFAKATGGLLIESLDDVLIKKLQGLA
jgi:hypothetical protein